MGLQRNSAITILGFSPALAPHFHRLNAEWLKRFFKLEPVDELVLNDPQQHILNRGGEILFAQRGLEIVGTCALMPRQEGAGHFELTKMGVTASAQGQGIGRCLLVAVLERYRKNCGRTLMLETNSQLLPAIRLYESVGFKQRPHPQGASVYERADVYMIYDPPVSVRAAGWAASPSHRRRKRLR
jgi:ribosomal protein S18 acetylase RimI-like enzyme